jgi:lipoyl synthase
MADPLQHKGAAKTSRIPIKIVPQERMRLPSWIRAKAPSLPNVGRLKGILREAKLHTVCEEASCPNLGECFGHGTATFMILGDLCTRRCPFCDVGHGTPLPPDVDEPRHLAETIALMALKYVVITSVDRDDLRDGGAGISRSASPPCASNRPPPASKSSPPIFAAGSTRPWKSSPPPRPT